MIEEADAVREDDGVVGENEETEKDAPPSDKFEAGMNSAERIGRSTLKVVAEREFEDEEGNADQKESDKVGDKKGPATMGV